MKSFRKITVNNQTYRWLFRYDDYEYSSSSYLLFVPEDAPKTQLRVTFGGDWEKFLLNSGLPAARDGEKVSINLNCPRYVAEILGFLLEQQRNHKLNPNQPPNGYAILKALGYEF